MSASAALGIFCKACFLPGQAGRVAATIAGRRDQPDATPGCHNLLPQPSAPACLQMLEAIRTLAVPCSPSNNDIKPQSSYQSAHTRSLQQQHQTSSPNHHMVPPTTTSDIKSQSSQGPSNNNIRHQAPIIIISVHGPPPYHHLQQLVHQER